MSESNSSSNSWLGMEYIRLGRPKNKLTKKISKKNEKICKYEKYQQIYLEGKKWGGGKWGIYSCSSLETENVSLW